jgi:hypothetical protein
MNDPGSLSEINQLQKDKCYMIPLRSIIKKLKLIATENSIVIARV